MARTVLETLSAILTLSTQGVEKTHLMQETYLNQHQLEKFLKALNHNKLLMEDGSFYKTTSKGLNFIEELEKIESAYTLPLIEI